MNTNNFCNVCSWYVPGVTGVSTFKCDCNQNFVFNLGADLPREGTYAIFCILFWVKRTRWNTRKGHVRRKYEPWLWPLKLLLVVVSRYNLIFTYSGTIYRAYRIRKSRRLRVRVHCAYVSELNRERKYTQLEFVFTYMYFVVCTINYIFIRRNKVE